jgi:hypothetical protein
MKRTNSEASASDTAASEIVLRLSHCTPEQREV